MQASAGTLLQFPFASRTFASRAIERCPALAAVFARLPDADGALWTGFERTFCAAVARLDRLPTLPAADAFLLLDPMAVSDDLIVEELGHIDADPARRDLAAFWHELHDDEPDADIRRCGLLVTALIGRLFRLEGRA